MKICTELTRAAISVHPPTPPPSVVDMSQYTWNDEPPDVMVYVPDADAGLFCSCCRHDDTEQVLV